MHRIVLGLLILTSIAGCGAIMNGRSQQISVNSSPSESRVVVQGEQRTTPAVFKLERKNSYLVKISKDGYETAEVMINKKLNWTAWADLLLLGIIPIFYDLASGAAYRLEPDVINVTLQRSVGKLGIPEKQSVRMTLKDGALSVSDSDASIAIERVE